MDPLISFKLGCSTKSLIIKDFDIGTVMVRLFRISSFIHHSIRLFFPRRELMYACMSALLLAFALLIPGFASAQVSTTGIIQVTVEDAQGGRLPGVTVTARAADTVTSRTVATDAQGIASLEALAPSAQYTVTVSLSGFRDITREGIRVSTGNITTLTEQMSLGGLTEAVTVVGQAAPIVDVKRAISGQDITLRLTESLPTGRSYQSYLQLVPGVLPDNQTQSGNPASRSGVNWTDVVTNGNLGVSTDNQYYFEGINVTDPYSGTFGANLNTEIIQEQKVITGGIPAEYVGSSGLISTVITKSGSNTYTGSANYFFQNQNLIAENENLQSGDFSTNDTAFTLGGPVVLNKLWGFGSFRYVDRTEDVNAQDTRQFIREVKTTQKQGFAKVSFVPTTSDLFSFTFLNDPFHRTGSPDPAVVNNRDRVRDQGGNRVSGTYNRVWNNVLLDGAVSYHDADITDRSVLREPRNTVAFRAGDDRTLTDEQLGGYGLDQPQTRPTRQLRLSGQYQVQQHRVKGGFEFTQREQHLNQLFLGNPPAQYTSISNRYGSVTAGDISNSAWSNRTFRTSVTNDFQGFINRVNTLPNRASFYSLYDANGDGTITPAELADRLVFGSMAGNPNGQINYYRSWMSQEGAQELQTRNPAFFVQDEITLNRLTFNVGVRAETQAHYATTGDQIFKFDWVFAPRLSAAYDVRGDGRQKVSAYWGRYYDPLRLDMTNFAGSLTGAVTEEQVFANNECVTYRVRGFADGLFTPTTKIPYTDELQFQHEIDLGRNMTVASTYWMRWTRDIFEDYDLNLYANPASYASGTGVPGPINDPQSLFLGYDYFGLDPNNLPAANFFLGTLPDAKRDYKGLEFVFRKRFSNNWQALSSYSYVDSEGNAISDGNADYPGDVLYLDPRAPNMTGTVPGTIHHLFKASGSYTTPFGLELGGTYNYNSGSVVNRTELIQSRRLPIQVAASEAFTFAGMNDRWVAPGTIGSVQNPGYGTFDTRVQYVRRFERITSEFFVDVFNLFNNQDPIRIEDLVAGSGANEFGSPIVWLNPRRAFLGARIRF